MKRPNHGDNKGSLKDLWTDTFFDNLNSNRLLQPNKELGIALVLETNVTYLENR